MKFPCVISDPVEAGLDNRPLHLALGMFDGVHLGHQAVIKSAVYSADRVGGVAGVMTFHPHPSKLLRAKRFTRLIHPPEMKADILFEFGVDLVIEKEFTLELAAMEAVEFLSFLKSALPSLNALYVGENFRFGRGRLGDISLLVEQAGKLGIHVISIDRLRLDGKPISSTRIREALNLGHIELVNSLLGYPYFCTGKIIAGRALGRTIGFPTLNLSWEPELKPKFGVYAVELRDRMTEKTFAGVANYGIRPSLNEGGAPLLEVHTLESNELAPGQEVTVTWKYFIRPEKRFENLEALRSQIALDKVKAEKLLVNC